MRIERRAAPAQLWVGCTALVLHAAARRGGELGGVLAQRALQGADLEQDCATITAFLAEHAALPLHVRVAAGRGRLLLLPWVEHLTSEERWHTYAQGRMEQVHGEQSLDWAVAVGRDLPGRARLAVAWPQALQRALASHRALRSVRFEILEHLTGLLAREPAFTGCVAEVDEDGACLLLLHAGRVRRARWCRFQDGAALGAAACAEWAALAAGLDAVAQDAAKDFGLALAPPAPVAGSRRAQAALALGAALNPQRSFVLAEAAA